MPNGSLQVGRANGDNMEETTNDKNVAVPPSPASGCSAAGVDETRSAHGEIIECEHCGAMVAEENSDLSWCFNVICRPCGIKEWGN